MPMGLRRVGVVRDTIVYLGINPAAPHGKAVLHFKLTRNLFGTAGNVESIVG